VVSEKINCICNRNIGEQRCHVETNHEIIWFQSYRFQNWNELNGVFYMVCQIPRELAEKSCQVLGEMVGGSDNVTDNGSQWDPSL
jgi:hypothetical protein